MQPSYGKIMTEHEPDWHPDGTCHVCGSMHPEIFLKKIKEGRPMMPTDRDDKAFIRNTPFYYTHLNADQRKEFIELYNSKRLRLDYPYYFYTLPFFCKTV